MKKDNIKVNPEKCTQCLSCALVCSFTYKGAFCPAAAAITIDPDRRIDFTEECRKGCSLCTRYCVPGALVRV